MLEMISWISDLPSFSHNRRKIHVFIDFLFFLNIEIRAFSSSFAVDCWHCFFGDPEKVRFHRKNAWSRKVFGACFMKRVVESSRFWPLRGPIWPVIYDRKICFLYTSRAVCLLFGRRRKGVEFCRSLSCEMHLLHFARSCAFVSALFFRKWWF